MRKLRNLACVMIAGTVYLGGIGLSVKEHVVRADDKNNTQETSTSLPALLSSSDLLDSLPQTMDEINTTTEEALESESFNNEENDVSISEQSTEKDESESTGEGQSKAVETVGDWQIQSIPSVSGYVEIYDYVGTDKSDIEIPRELDGKPTLISWQALKKMTSSNQTKYLFVSESGLSNGAQLYGDFSLELDKIMSDELLSIDLSNAIAPSTAINTSEMFSTRTSGGLPNVQTIKLPKGLKSTNTRSMFDGSYNITELDLNDLNTSEVTDMSSMFQFVQKLEKLDVSSFDTSKVEKMRDMFNNASSLRELDLANFDTSEVIDMGRMFKDCQNLEKLNVSSFNTSKVTIFEDMFSTVSSLKELDVRNFDTSNAQTLSRMFELTNFSTLDLSSFNVSENVNIEGLFLQDTHLRIVDLSNFDMNGTIDVDSLFGYHMAPHPLLLIADDPTFLSTQPSRGTNGLKIFELSIEANGGTFADGSSKKNFFDSIAITSEEAKSLLPDIKQFLEDNQPTWSPQSFEEWKVTKGTHVNEIDDIFDLVETNYSAVWKSPSLSSVPNELSFSSKLNKGPMSVQQAINGDSVVQNRLVFFADSSGPKDWQITGQLNWNGNAIPNSSLATTSNSQVYMSNQPDGSNPSEHQSDVISSLNMTISTIPTPVVEIRSISVSNYYMIELGTISLVIDDGEAVKAGTYSGSINWDINLTP